MCVFTPCVFVLEQAVAASRQSKSVVNTGSFIGRVEYAV